MVKFKLVSATDGHELGELANIQTNNIAVSMLDVETASFKVPYSSLPADWVGSLQPYKSVIILENDGIALYGGFITKRTRAQSSDTVQLDCTDVLGYFKRVYVPTLSYSQVSQTLILKNVINETLRYSTVPIVVEATESPIKRDRTYNEADNKTLFDVIDSFNGLDNGTELSHEWAFNTIKRVWECTIYLADHIGSQQPLQLDASIFNDFSIVEDYTAGYGANSILAYSSSGNSQLESSWHSSKYWGRPLLQYKWSPSSSITNVDTLNSYAAQKLHDIELGSVSYSFSCAFNLLPPFGIVWHCGDLMSFTINSRQFPDLQKLTIRVVGYKIDFSNGWTITLLLQ